MKAAKTPKYGAPEVIEFIEVPTEALGAGEVRVAVRAAAVTAGDRRLRSADFPGVAKIGRLMVGLTRPRHAVQGTMFAGEVIEVAGDVDRFDVGDRVFGMVDHGAYAEEVVFAQDGPVALIPEGLSFDEAAATPYGALTALEFLRDLGNLAAGERVLILGASGGVGRYAIEIARHLGAHVTAVCSGRHEALARRLGAHEVIDYREANILESSETFDVIFDIADATSFAACKHLLDEGGRYLTLTLSLQVIWQMVRTKRASRSAIFSVSLPDREQVEELAGMLAAGVVHPHIIHRFPFERIVEAHETSARDTAGETMVMIGASLSKENPQPPGQVSKEDSQEGSPSSPRELRRAG